MLMKTVLPMVCATALTLLAPAVTSQGVDPDRNGENAVFALLGPITFTDPLSFGTPATLGLSIEDVLELGPSYPPIDGIPVTMWQNQSCVSCHQWTRDTLCEQGKAYVAANPSSYQTKNHPFGGTFKMSLRHWALGGCS